MIKLAVVDDKMVNRKIVQANLHGQQEIIITIEAGNGEEFLEKMKIAGEKALPHVVLMDIDMPIMNGIDTIAIASIKYPHIKYLILTVFDDDEKIFEAIQAGASGYLLKDDSAVQLKEAIVNAVEYNGAPMSPAIARKTLNWMRQANISHPKTDTQNTEILSTREIEVLKLIVEGLDFRKIAEKLFISPHTVRTHISKIYEKLHVNSKAQAISAAHKYNWV
jgi:DNA-binding NarL/FixJ family response regulator